MNVHPTPYEVAVATARLEYGVPLTAFNRWVLDRASSGLDDAMAAVTGGTDDRRNVGRLTQPHREGRREA